MQDIEQKRLALLRHFVAMCQADERVVAAFLGALLPERRLTPIPI